MNTPVGPTLESVARLQRKHGLTLAEAVALMDASPTAGAGGLCFRSPAGCCPNRGDTPEFPAVPCRLCGA